LEKGKTQQTVLKARSPNPLGGTVFKISRRKKKKTAEKETYKEKSKGRGEDVRGS